MRRREIIAAGVGGMALLAGCSTPDDSASDTGGQDIAKPQIAGLDDDRWALVNDRQEIHEQSVALTDITGYERTLMYENSDLKNRLSEWTFGNFDSTVMMFFASRIEFQGLLSGGIPVSKIADLGKEALVEQMKDQGLTNVVEESVSGSTPDLGFRSETYKYSAAYEIQDFRREMDLENIGTREIVLEGTSLDVTALFSVWRDGSDLGYIAGGVFPAESYSDFGTTSLSGGDTRRGIDVTVEIDLQLQPDAYRSEVVDMIERVS